MGKRRENGGGRGERNVLEKNNPDSVMDSLRFTAWPSYKYLETSVSAL